MLVRSRQHFACTTRCESTLRRIVWDGDQVLAEIQAPGYSYGPVDMERDTGFKVAATSGVTGDPLDAPAGTSTTYPGFYFGRVIYTHGPGIDHPLSITRLEYSDSMRGPITIYPHENWNGAFDLGSYDGGSLTTTCKLLHSSGITTPFQVFTPGPDGSTKTTTTDTTSQCLKVDWPAPHLWLTNRIRENNQVGAERWNGSLIDGMRDATGLMYMRNRYYDPALGRFTQQDPIGIAGGLNVYGFGGGDPVSYSDPYGLTIIIHGDADYRDLLLREMMYLAQHSRTFKRVFDLLRSSEDVEIHIGPDFHMDCSSGTAGSLNNNCTGRPNSIRGDLTLTQHGLVDGFVEDGFVVAHEIFHAAAMVNRMLQAGVQNVCGNPHSSEYEACAKRYEEQVRKEVHESQAQERSQNDAH